MKRFYLTNGIKATKNKVGTFFLSAVLLVTAVVLVQSCKKDPPEEEEKDKPVITSVTPPSAEVGGTITINGQYFAEVASENIVKIADEIAHVESGNTSSIQVTVPNEVAVGPAAIKVTANGLTSDEYTGFSVSETLPELVIDSYTEEGTYGDLITITGSGFVDESKVIVTINDILQDSALTVTDTKITFILKPKTFSGDFVLNRAGTKRTLCSFVNHLSFVVTGFKDVVAAYLAICPVTNNVFFSGGANGDLKRINSSDGTVTTIYNNDDISFSAGLFVDNTGTLYNADAKGRLLRLKKEADVVDTLIGMDEDPELFKELFWDLTGDNNGYLYATSFDTMIYKIDVTTENADVEILYSIEEYTYSICIGLDKVYTTLDGKDVLVGNTDGSIGTDIITSPTNIPSASNILAYHEQLGLLIANGIAVGDICILNESDEFVQLLSPDKISNSEVISMTVDSEGDLLVGGLSKISKIKIQ